MMRAGRALCFPTRAVREVGLVDAVRLPHYHGDYEYTARARPRATGGSSSRTSRSGNEVEHTEIKSGNPHSTLWRRFGDQRASSHPPT